MLTDLETVSRRVGRLEEMLAQVVRVGMVTQTDPKSHKVKVLFPEQDLLESDWLWVVAHKTHADKAYWLPDRDEQVLCLFLPNSHEVGFVLGAIYSDKDPVPVESQDKAHIRFQDGAWAEYDRNSGEMALHVKTKLILRAGTEIEIFAPRILMTKPTFMGPIPPLIQPTMPQPYVPPALLEPPGPPAPAEPPDGGTSHE
ncbi:MAG: phage baseplate assembly protein V [Deltaproteobacteria bacterium]|nr:phage baseplate assembly protein V [Deltaproteobacteria bacterium]